MVLPKPDRGPAGTWAWSERNLVVVQPEPDRGPTEIRAEPDRGPTGSWLDSCRITVGFLPDRDQILADLELEFSVISAAIAPDSS